MGREKASKPRRLKAVYGVVEVDGLPVTVRLPGNASPGVLHNPQVAADLVVAARRYRLAGNPNRMITVERSRNGSP